MDVKPTRGNSYCRSFSSLELGRGPDPRTSEPISFPLEADVRNGTSTAQVVYYSERVARDLANICVNKFIGHSGVVWTA